MHMQNVQYVFIYFHCNMCMHLRLPTNKMNAKVQYVYIKKIFKS